jgi:hypothetical protein
MAKSFLFIVFLLTSSISSYSQELPWSNVKKVIQVSKYNFNGDEQIIDAKLTPLRIAVTVIGTLIAHLKLATDIWITRVILMEFGSTTFFTQIGMNFFVRDFISSQLERIYATMKKASRILRARILMRLLPDMFLIWTVN